MRHWSINSLHRSMTYSPPPPPSALDPPKDCVLSPFLCTLLTKMPRLPYFKVCGWHRLSSGWMHHHRWWVWLQAGDGAEKTSSILISFYRGRILYSCMAASLWKRKRFCRECWRPQKGLWKAVCSSTCRRGPPTSRRLSHILQTLSLRKRLQSITSGTTRLKNNYRYTDRLFTCGGAL